MDVIDDRKEVLLVTSLAFGKRTPIEDYRHTSRAAKASRPSPAARRRRHVVDQSWSRPAIRF